MSISYSTLFSRLGKVIKYVNLWIAQQSTNTGIVASVDFITPFTARPDLIAGSTQGFNSNASTLAGWCSTIKKYADQTLGDTQQALNATGSSPQAILPLLALNMIAAGQTVNKNNISAPSITYGTIQANTGNGLVVTNIKTAAGINDERIISELVQGVCTSDQFSGSAAGAETFSLTGYPAQSTYNGVFPRGNGNGPTIQVFGTGSNNLLANAGFDTTGGTYPTGWNVSAGGALVTANTTAGSLHSATSTAAMQFAGNGSAATVTVSQGISGLSGINTLTVLAAGVWVRIAGTVTSGSNLQIDLVGTGFTAVNLFNADPSTLTTSYALKSAFVATGTTIPADLRLQINWTSANSAGASAVILFDDAALGLPTMFGNVGYAIYRGSVDFLQEDSFTVQTTNDYAGVIQTFFGRVYNTALPSAAPGSATIPDSDAT